MVKERRFSKFLPLLRTDPKKITGEIFNVCSVENTYWLGDIGKRAASTVSEIVGKPVGIEWYEQRDHRS